MQTISSIIVTNSNGKSKEYTLPQLWHNVTEGMTEVYICPVGIQNKYICACRQGHCPTVYIKTVKFTDGTELQHIDNKEMLQALCDATYCPVCPACVAAHIDVYGGD